MSLNTVALLICVVSVASASLYAGAPGPVPGAYHSEPRPMLHSDSSLEVEKHYNPTVVALEHGEHRLTYKNDAGNEACVDCQPFQGCGCSDVAAIRCELKRLKQKLMRLQTLADPHNPAVHAPVHEPTMHILPHVMPVLHNAPVVHAAPLH